MRSKSGEFLVMLKEEWMGREIEVSGVMGVMRCEVDKLQLEGDEIVGGDVELGREMRLGVKEFSEVPVQAGADEIVECCYYVRSGEGVGVVRVLEK